MSEDSYQSILDDLSNGNLREAIESLKSIVKERDFGVEIEHRVNRLSGRYFSFRKRWEAGEIPYSEGSITESQILNGLLGLLEELKGKGIQSEKRGTWAAEHNFSKKLKILFVGANPANAKRTFFDFEYDEISEALLGNDRNEGIELFPLMAATPERLMSFILRYKPNIVHFSCHGSEEGLYFLGKKKEALLIGAKNLREMFQIFKDVVGAVIINADCSENVGREIRKYIEFVVGVNSPITSGTAVDFSSLFYEMLSRGESLEFCFEYARTVASASRDDAKNYILL